MRIAVCDDAKQYRMQVLYLLTEYSEKKHLDFSISEFSNPTELLKETEKSSGFDIYIYLI